MRNASFQKTYTIKIHGVTDGTDIPKIVGRELWDTLNRLSENTNLHFTFIEEEEYFADPEEASDLWPEFDPTKARMVEVSDTIIVNAPSQPRIRGELSPGVDIVEPVR